jgi:capsular polysaccharide biosynthesis protein
MDTEDIGYLLLYRTTRRIWWIFPLAAICGAFIGWMISKVLQPQFYASTSLVVTMDYSQTGNLSAYNFDLAVGAIQGIFFSGEVLDEVVSIVQEDGIQINPQELFNRISMERYNDIWVLRVRYNDPAIAAKLVNTWAEVGFNQSITARSHAQTARILRNYMNALENCPDPPVSLPSIPMICLDAYRLKNGEIAEIQAAYEVELSQARSIQSALLFSLNAPATPPSQPVNHAAAWLILSGSVVAFMASILFSSLYFRSQIT